MPIPKIEHRTFTLDNLAIETRAEEPGKIIGHAAVFDVIGDGSWFRERIAKGAFANSIQTDDVRALFNHDPNFVLGRNRAGTLKLAEDERGLLVHIEPPDTQYARDIKTSILRGDISQMSFGFEIIKDSWERQKDQPDLRTLEEIKLWDVSPVTFPFYVQTDVAVRSHERWIKSQRKNGLKVKLMQREFESKRK